MDSEIESNDILADKNIDSNSSGFSWENRIYSFVLAVVLSLVCSVLGSPFLFVGKLTEFAVMVSIGSIISIIGTFFLSGLRNSLKKMAEPSRLIASIVYFLMIGLTLFAGLSLRSPPIAIFCIIGQYLAMFWYSITYIPYARNMVSVLISRVL